jgi:hypothetical protein
VACSKSERSPLLTFLFDSVLPRSRASEESKFIESNHHIETQRNGCPRFWV